MSTYNPIEFKLILDNAGTFIRRAVKQIEKEPDLSLICFATAVELFLKARLAAEHWSLILVDPTNVKNLKTGDFQTVSPSDAIKRITTVTNEQLPKATITSFNSLANHRNQVIHCYHPNLNDVVIEQYKAWHHLHGLLTGLWSEIFISFKNEIYSLDQEMRTYKQYLEIIFSSLKPEITGKKAGGKIFEKCGSCGFEAAELNDNIAPHYSLRCLVCRWHDEFHSDNCPECEKQIRVRGIDSECECGWSPHDVYNEYVDYNRGEIQNIINCGFCETRYCVISLNDKYLCLTCLETEEYPGTCDQCSEELIGLSEDRQDNTFYLGCGFCEGFDIHK